MSTETSKKFVTIRLPKEAHKKAKLEAVKQEKTLQDYLTDLIDENTDNEKQIEGEK